MTDALVPLPPQDLDAEESVLGAMLLSNKAIDAVLDTGLAPAHFYRESHGAVFRSILSLYSRNVGADAITVSDHLKETGDLEKAGGVGRIHELSALVPSAANAGHYATIVRDMATLRAMLATGTELRTLAMVRGKPVRELLEEAEAAMLAMTIESRSQDFSLLTETLAEAWRDVEERSRAGKTVVGLPTGFERIDRLTAGLEPGNLIIIAARPSMGKRLRFDARVLTPTGWRRMRDLWVGCQVIGADGKPDVVLSVDDELEPLDFYRVTFSDGATVECCGEHLWLTRTRRERLAELPGSTRTTLELIDTLRRSDGHGWNHTVPFVEPVEFDPKDEPLPLDPYWLGLYLGDGDSSGQVRLTNPEYDLQERFMELLPEGDIEGARHSGTGGCPTLTVRRTQRTNRPSNSKEALMDLGLAGCRSYEKFVPACYLGASIGDRIALLQGLFDTDGYVTDPAGACIEYTTSSIRLRDDVMFLVGSLGGRVSTVTRATACRDSHRMVVSFPRGGITPVRSEKHLRKWRGGPHLRGRERSIVSVEPIGRFPGRCISVGRSLYVTDGFVVTHNTALALNMAAHVAVGHGLPVALFTLEMSRKEVTHRLMSAEGLVPSGKIRTGQLNGEDWSKLTSAASRLDVAPLHIDDSGAITAMELRSKARRLKMRVPDLALVVIDYIQLMSSGTERENRQQDVSATSRALKVLAGELQVPVVALSQLSRQPESRHDKRPILSDLRESGSIEQDADIVMFVYRDEYYHPEDTDQEGIAEINLAKNRNGETGTVKLAFIKRYTRFTDLAPDQ